MQDKPLELKIIARIRTDFPTKFGIPRQCGLAGTVGKIVFEPEFRVREAVRGLDGYSPIWLIWHFSETPIDTWSPTVRPPRLGGNVRMGVFATRSPFRPNQMGLSSVKLERVDLDDPEGPVLYVTGADMMDNTPIFDIKPYAAFSDSHPDAIGGFADKRPDYSLAVEDPDNLLSLIPKEKQVILRDVLSCDPRPAYHDEPERIYGFGFAGFEINFKVANSILTITNIAPAD